MEVTKPKHRRRCLENLALSAALLLSLAATVEAQSLWSREVARPRSFYSADPHPEIRYNINDLVLVIVRETATARNNSNTNLRRKFDLRAELNEWAKFDPGAFTLRAADPTTLPSLDLRSEKRQEGRGSTDRNELITGRLTARVVDVRPNGNLLIEGRTTRLINDEETVLTVFGEVCCDDINPKTRAVQSERIADLKLVFSGSGPVSRNLGRTILSWALEWLWPF